MGSAASTSHISSASKSSLLVKNHASRGKIPFQSLSIKNAFVSKKLIAKDFSYFKVPLNLALSAAIVIQKYLRRFLARRRVAKLRIKAKNEELAAAEYLLSVRESRIKSERSGDRGILRRSWIEGLDGPTTTRLGSFSMSHRSPADHGHNIHAAFTHILGSSRSESHFQSHRFSHTSLPIALETTVEEEAHLTAEDKRLIYPFIGFVIKGKLENSGRKIFINVSHSPDVKRALASSMRLWTEEKHYDEEGELRVEELIVVDCVMPSVDFEEHFIYKDGQGLVPVDSTIKEMISDECIMLLNSLDQCPDSFSAPIPGLRYSEDYRINPHTNLPKIKRAYVGPIMPFLYDPNDSVMSVQPPFRLSKELPPISTYATSTKCPPEVKFQMALAWSCLGNTSDVMLSKIAQVGQRDTKLPLFGDADDEIGQELESHQKHYVDQVRRLKEGYRVFVILNYGMLYIYSSENDESPSENTRGSLNFGKYPYGKQELLRLVLSSVDLDVSSDLINDLFFLHMEFISEELETLFVLSKFLNRISSTTINMRKITFQFERYSELVTWKAVFEHHMQYAQYAMAKLPTLQQSVKFHNMGLFSLPSGKSSWFTEKLSKRMRRRIFSKIDRGWWIVFPNDSSVTSSLSNAIEIFSLASMRCEVSHKKIIRLRKWITKITLFNDEEKSKREFYFKSDEGETDPETKGILTTISININYAHSQYYRYLLPWLEDNEMLLDFSSALGNSKSTTLNWVACTVDMLISIPEPQTSDDDSDVEVNQEVDESITGSLFRVLKPKNSNNPNTNMMQSKGISTRNIRTVDDSSSLSQLNRFQQVSDRINKQHNDFTNSFFRGRILLYQDQNCLLFIHENRIVGILNIARCLEKTFPACKSKKSTSKATPIDISIYDLQSDDEDSDSSDRDYFDNDNRKEEEEKVKEWIVQLIAYDGRVYKLKFMNGIEYEDWRKCFLSRCITPTLPNASVPLVSPIKVQQNSKSVKGESFKGNHSFEFLKEHMISGAESTASTASIMTSSTLSLNPTSSSTSINRQQISSTRQSVEVGVDIENTKKYTRSLRVQEKVYACGIVFKYEKTLSNASTANAPKQKRILLVTDVPRMIFIDPIGNIARGNIELLPELKVEAREIDSTDFEVLVAGVSSRFSVADDKDPKYWVRCLQFLISKF